MIAGDQFSNLPRDLLVAFSSRDDGTVLDRTQLTHLPAVVENRRAICRAVGVSYDDVVYQRIVYSDSATYGVIKEVDRTMTTRFMDDVTADALFTREVGVGLFLPVADCIVTVMYDPRQRFLAQLHMGRHSTLTSLLDDMIERFRTLGSDVNDLLVWMEPSVTKAHYRLDYFEAADSPQWRDYVERRDGGYCLDMQGFNRDKLLKHGIRSEHITISPIDTYENQNYFSHVRGDKGGRFAGIAMMR